MDQLIDNLSNNILILKEYFTTEQGDHYPREIINLIIVLYYELFNVKLSCYSNNEFIAQVIIAGNIHSSEKVDAMFYVSDVVKLISNNRSTFYLTKFGEVYFYENNTACSKLDISHIVDIACGSGHAVFLSDIGEVYTWITFAKNFGQSGVPDDKYVGNINKVNLRHIDKICAGGNSSMALNHAGEVYSWGANDHGQLGLGHRENQYFPQKVIFQNEKEKEKVTKISCGNTHSIFLTEKNNIYGCGHNNFYRFGVDHIENILLPRKLNISDIVDIGCGKYSTIVLTKYNKIHYYEHWVIDGTVHLENVIQIGIGGSHAIVMTASLEIYALGGRNDEINKIKFDFNKNKLR